jgi:hypothetical protein
MSINNLTKENGFELDCHGITFSNKGTTGPTNLLSYYRQETQQSMSFSGIWANPIVSSIRYIRIGNITTLTISGCLGNATTPSFITSDDVLPPHFRPSYLVNIPTVIRNNSPTDSFGTLQVTVGGSIIVYPAAAGAVAQLFNGASGSSNSGFYGITLSYVCLNNP